MEQDIDINHRQPNGITSEIDHVIKLIEGLYNSNEPERQHQSNLELTQILASDRIWDFCWPLLDPTRKTSPEVPFVIANSLVHKLNQSWNQLDQEWLEKQLRPKLFEVLVSYSSSPDGIKLVIERLSLALATFALHSIPSFWPNAIQDILLHLTPQNLVSPIPPTRVCEILMKILMYIPEEYSVLIHQQEDRAKLSCQMTKAGPIVFKFLYSLLSVDKETLNTGCRESILKCITSWTSHSQTSILELDEGAVILNLLYDTIRDSELCPLACAAIGATFSTQKADSFKNSVIEFIPKIAGLKSILDDYIRADDMENAIKIYSLVINFSENHSKIYLDIVLDGKLPVKEELSAHIKQDISTIISIILDCTSAPGIYGVDEKYSDLTFTFWCTFMENFYYFADSYNDLICETFNPLVDSLLQKLMAKAQYPPMSIYYQSWNDDDRESHRCYRQDIADNISLVANFPRARERILSQLNSQMEQELAKMLHSGDSVGAEQNWQLFEATVFGLKSIGEAIPYDEAIVMPKLLSNLSQVPYNETHPLLYCTVAELISSYSDWLYANPSFLVLAFNILFLGVNSTNHQVLLMSTLSLKDLASECRMNLQPYAAQIVTSCTEAILRTESSLTTNERARLMHTIGTSLSMCQSESVMGYLSTLSTPLLNQLKAAAQADPNLDPSCRSLILERLTMFNSLIESLYIQKHSPAEYEEGDENDPNLLERFEDSFEGADVVQPALSLLRELIPTLISVARKYRSDEEIMEIICNTVKRSAKSLGIQVKDVLADLLMLMVNVYDPLTNPSILDGCIPMYQLFVIDESVHKYLLDVFAKVSELTLKACNGVPLNQLASTIEVFFRLATLVARKYESFVASLEMSPNIEYIHKLAIASLELPEKRPLTEAAGFLLQFRTTSFNNDHLSRIHKDHLDQVINNIFNIFGGNYSTPRNAVEPVTELLFTLMSDGEARESLNAISLRENFPTSFVDTSQKARFVSSILHERNRRKFKDKCAAFVLSARNLNRQ